MRLRHFHPASIFHPALAICALLIASLTLFDIGFYGFPDSHVTEYETAVRMPLTVLSWTLVGTSSLSLFFSVCRRRTARTLLARISIVLMVLLLATLVALPWYFGSYLGLDNGIGG